MKTKLYLRGVRSSCNTRLSCPLSSSSILYIIQYCQTDLFQLVFVTGDPPHGQHEEFCCSFAVKDLTTLDISFAQWEEIPQLLRNVSLPSLLQSKMSLVRSGQCVLLRHIIKEAHSAAPDSHLIDLLGFRQGSMKMCAEVSGWTKLCEVELASSIGSLIKQLSSSFSKNENSAADQSSQVLTLPLDLVKLEGHFSKKCRIHNDDRKRRSELSGLKKHLSQCDLNEIKNCNISHERGDKSFSGLENNKATESLVGITPNGNGAESKEPLSKIEIENLILNRARLYIEQVNHLHHGVRKFKVDKKLCGEEVETHSTELSVSGSQPKDSCIPMSELESKFGLVKLTDCQTTGMQSLSTPSDAHKETDSIYGDRDLSEAMGTLTYLDIQYVHLYSEGIEMTVADLILLAYVYHLTKALKFNCSPLMCHIPNILRWADHMVSLRSVRSAGERLGWFMEKFQDSLLRRQSDLSPDGVDCKEFSFLPAVDSTVDEDEMELSRCAKVKHKAIKPEVLLTLKKLENSSVQAVTGSHPCGESVQVDWNNLPPGVHPKEGDVPEKRTRRKCQQLENLVTAVQSVAKPGDIIVDFCSGGGHLGIVIAYLLPECQVYLVENKEESLLKACSRLEALNLSNVALYQCNLDYFVGKFHVGVCLHACGSATDMVLQLCLNVNAAFVICPCCYGSIRKTHLLSYPRSDRFLSISLTYKDFLTLGHAADQTEFNIALETQGRTCMNLVDTDRAEFARQQGYQVCLCSLQPLSCSPKNNLLIGVPSQRSL
ncbi:glutathione S-transferase C-terminal domain-containing protein [Aplysia californica]|uniref:Glutathione S-transferase C-terminal domain-containing protein n=1 Tax=Aplysia californica TaxID=6500 RepID=A0ABM1VYK8_APLCA|nr:glutathione S-transferase C-terminal domain-containing protein [Aplysia californica]